MRIVKHICSVILLVTSLSYANAEERIVTISAPNSLIASGFFDYIFPRFKLKTQISVKLVPDSAMISISKNSGRAFLQMGDILYKIDINEENNYSLKFFDWLKSDVGKKTISSIQKNVYILADGNPAPDVAKFSFTPEMGVCSATTRIRLSKTQNVVFVAENNKNEYFMTKSKVKVTIGGCGG